MAYVREHIIYTVYSDCVLVFAFAFLSCKKKKKKKKKKKSALNRTFSTESYRNKQKSINILKNNGLFLKNKQKILKKENNGQHFDCLENSKPPSPPPPHTSRPSYTNSNFCSFNVKFMSLDR